MAMDIDKADYGNMENTVSDWEIDTETLDSAEAGKESSYTNSNFKKWLGYYKNIAELNAVINTKAFWTVGKGYEADEKTKKILDKIVGWGKDTFDTIIENCIIMYNVSGDAFCEIIRDSAGRIKNLKPLNPGRIKIIVDNAGIIKRYEQIVQGNENIKFPPEDVFHLAWNRIGDEIHGTSIIQGLEEIVKKRNEAMDDLRIVFHRYVKPLWVWQLDTDDETKIAKFKAKADKTVENSENIYIPKGAAEAERMSVPQYSSLDPLPWIKNLTDYFYEAANIPEVILGSAENTTEASSKILYLAFQQSIEKNQTFIENQIKTQLGLNVNFSFPASLEHSLQEDEKKDSENTFQKSDTEAGIEGKT